MTTPDAPVRPALPRTVLVLLGGAAGVIIIAGLQSISEIIAPAFLALVFTITAHPLRGVLMRKGAPAWLATTAVIVTVYLVLLGLILSLVVSVARLAELLPQYSDDLQNLVDDATKWLTDLGVDQAQLSAIADALDPNQLISFVGSLFEGLLSVLSDLLFIVLLLLFLAIDGAGFGQRLEAITDGHRSAAVAMTSFAVGTRRYIVVSSIFGLIVALLDVGLLYLLGVPLPWLWGLLAFITNYIPNIGFVIGLVPPMILALLEDGWSGALAVLIGYCLLNAVIQSGIQPKFVGDAVGLTASLTFLSLVFWAWVFGALGALLAIPLSLLVKAVLVDSDPRSQWLVPLLSGNEQSPGSDDAPATAEAEGGVDHE